MNRCSEGASIVGIVSLCVFLCMPAARAFRGVTVAEAGAVAEEACIYGFAPILLEVQRQAFLRYQGGMNRLMRHGDPAQEIEAYLDLTREPMVLCSPDAQEGPFSFQVMDAGTNALTVQNKGCVAVCGARWKGTLPVGLGRVNCATNIAYIRGLWICGNTGIPEKQVSLTPLARYGKRERLLPEKAEQGFPGRSSPLRQVLLMDMQAFYGRLASFLKRTPVPRADSALLGRMARIGIDRDTGFFDTSALTPAARAEVEQGLRRGMDRIARHAFAGFPAKNGWTEVPHGPAPEDDHLARAARAYLGIGGMPSGSGVWLVRAADAQGEGLTGSLSYLIQFNRDRLLHAQACCSLSVFDRKTCREYPGITVGQDALQKAPDGSMKIFIQQLDPGADAQGLWVKAPEGDFALMLRSFQGAEDGAGAASWYPEVERVSP
jgi:hypothetical protein